MMLEHTFTILGIMDRIQLAIDGSEYQTVGMIVVFGCLGLLAVILAISAAIATRLNAKPVAPAASAAPANPAAPAKAPAPAGAANLSPELIAVISAAVNTALDGMQHRILDIKQTPYSGYSASGRSEIFASHRITPRSR